MMSVKVDRIEDFDTSAWATGSKTLSTTYRNFRVPLIFRVCGVEYIYDLERLSMEDFLEGNESSLCSDSLKI